MKYVPSRFNFRTSGPNGDTILYNSMAGSLSAVELEDKAKVEYYLHKNTVVEDPEDPFVLELIEGGFMIETEVDETQELFDLMEIRKENSELHITILPTEDCNFRCVYCFEHFKRGAMAVEIQDGVFEFVRKQLQRENAPYDRLHINWFGGEPLYAYDVMLRLGEKFQTLAAETGVEYVSSMTTNGYLLTPEVFETLLDLGLGVYTVTLDGLKHTHDATRVHREGTETFDTIFENLRYMKSTDHEFIVQLRTNYTPEVYETLEDFLALLQKEFGGDKRFDNFDIRPIFNHGGFNEGNFDECVSVHMKTKFKGLARASKFDLWNRHLKNYIQPGGIVCNASKPNFWMFGSDGKVMRCQVELDTHERNVVGQVVDGGVELDYDKLTRWLDAGKDDKLCHSCYFAPSCQGAYCGMRRFTNEEMGGTHKQPCPTEKKQLAELLRLVYEEMLLV